MRSPILRLDEDSRNYLKLNAEVLIIGEKMLRMEKKI